MTTRPDTFWGSGNKGQFAIGQMVHGYLGEVTKSSSDSCRSQAPDIRVPIESANVHYKYAPSSWLVPFSPIKIGWIQVELKTQNLLAGSSQSVPITVMSGYDTPLSDIWSYMPPEQPVEMVMTDLMVSYTKAVANSFKAQLPQC